MKKPLFFGLVFFLCVILAGCSMLNSPTPGEDAFEMESTTYEMAPAAGEATSTPFQPLATATPLPTEITVASIPTETPVLLQGQPTATPEDSLAQPTATLENTLEQPTVTSVDTQARPTDAPTASPNSVPVETEVPTETPEPQAVDASAQTTRLPNPFPPARGAPTPYPNLSDEAPGKTINVLLIGSDQRDGGSFRTDTILIASVRPDNDLISILSIPRDLYVYLPGRGMNKINTAYIYGRMDHYPGGGPQLLKDTLMYNLGIRIDKMAMVNFDGFRKMIDIIGGIDVPLACQFTDLRVKNKYGSDTDPNNWRLFSIGPGVEHMDGSLALWYARARLKTSDYDRGRRQQEVIRAIYSKALKSNVFLHIPDLYNEMRDSVVTDVELGDLVDLIPMALKLDAAQVRSYYIHAGLVKSGFTPDGMFVLYPKSWQVLNVVQKFLWPPVPVETTRLQVKVEVCNATKQKDWGPLASERLHYAGFKTVECTLETVDRQGETTIQDLQGEQPSQVAESLLASLGLPLSRLTSALAADSKAQFRVILGGDYNPCFKPFQLTH